MNSCWTWGGIPLQNGQERNNDNDLPWAKRWSEDDLASHQQKIAKKSQAKKAEQITNLKRY